MQKSVGRFRGLVGFAATGISPTKLIVIIIFVLKV